MAVRTRQSSPVRNVVVFGVSLIPARPVTITYQIDKLTVILDLNEATWRHEETVAGTPLVLALKVELKGTGGFAMGIVEINGRVVAYEHRNDARDVVITYVRT